MIKKASKKLIVLAVAAVMALGVFGLTACVQSLDDYKASAKVEIQAHADAKLAVNGYSAEGLTAIAQAVTAGKEAVDNAETKPAVRKARDDAKTAINAVEPKEGEMAKHSHSDPRIDTQIEIRIRQDFAKRFPEDSDITAKDIWVAFYYGTYNDNSVVVMNYKDNNMPPQMIEIEVAGFEFWYNTGLAILVWGDGEFYGILKAYEDGLLTIGDIENAWLQSQQPLQ